MEGFYLGVDLGTSSIKVSVSNYNGEIVCAKSHSYPLLTPKKNWTEQNPNDWYNAFIKVLKSLGTKIDLSLVNAISFCGQMHGLVVLDKNDIVIRPAILWNDSRTTSEVDYLNNVIGKETLINETGNIALCGFTAPKVLWIKNNEPDNFEKISKIMLPKDYLVYKLTKNFVSDVSDLAGTLFLNVESKKYSSKMLSILGIKEEQLPEIHESYDCVGNVCKQVSLITGLNPNCKVVVGGGDQAVGAIGTNTTQNNDLFISLGTSGVVFTSIDSYKFDKNGRVHAFDHANGKYLLMGCTLSCAASLNWWLKDILRVRNYDREFSKIDFSNVSDIVFLPYLCGERSPINDPDAKGYFANLNSFYKRDEMTKAVVEGITFSLYDIYKVYKSLGLSFEKARVIGGGSKNKKWLQMLADTFGIKVTTINTSDGGTLGAIILAMVGDGRYSSVQEACNDLVKDVDEYYPNLELHQKYELKFNLYKDIYNLQVKLRK